MTWTLGAGTVVFFVLAVALGWKLLQVSDKAAKERRRLHEMSRQRRHLGREIAEVRRRLRAAETFGQQKYREAEDVGARLLDLEGRHTILLGQFQKLGDKHSKIAQRLQEMERDPHYENGCAKQGAFRLEEDAKLFAEYLESKSGEPMNVYPCKQCREYFTENVIYHVGHAETRAMRTAALTRLSPENMARLRDKVTQTVSS